MSRCYVGYLFLNRLALSHFYILLIKYSLFSSLFPFLSHSVCRTLPISLPKFKSSASLSSHSLLPFRRNLLRFLSSPLPVSVFFLFIYFNVYTCGVSNMSNPTILPLLFRSSFIFSNFVYIIVPLILLDSSSRFILGSYFIPPRFTTPTSFPLLHYLAFFPLSSFIFSCNRFSLQCPVHDYVPSF